MKFGLVFLLFASLCVTINEVRCSIEFINRAMDFLKRLPKSPIEIGREQRDLNDVSDADNNFESLSDSGKLVLDFYFLYLSYSSLIFYFILYQYSQKTHHCTVQSSAAIQRCTATATLIRFVREPATI